MARKVSLWVVIALVGALAATTAAVIVLATHDDGATSKSVAGLQPGDGWPGGAYGDQDGSDSMMPPGAQGGGPMQIVGDAPGEWGDGHDASLLPWMLFAIATGAAVGLLIAWSPWRAATVDATGPGRGAGVPTGTPADVTGTPQEGPAVEAVTTSTDEAAASDAAVGSTDGPAAEEVVPAVAEAAAPQATGSASEVTHAAPASEAPSKAGEEDERPSDV